LLEESDEAQRIAERGAIEEADENETSESILLSATPGQRTRYLHLFQIAKQIAQRGSNTPARYEELSRTLTGVLESLTRGYGGEIYDADGRHKGDRVGPVFLTINENDRLAPFAVIRMTYSDAQCTKSLWRRKCGMLALGKAIGIASCAGLLDMAKPRVLFWEPSGAGPP
jgi:hypothetical protein